MASKIVMIKNIRGYISVCLEQIYIKIGIVALFSCGKEGRFEDGES